MSQKTIAIVTGGAGFIGSHMVDLLRKEGYQVRVIDNLVTGRLENLEHFQHDPYVSVDTRDQLKHMDRVENVRDFPIGLLRDCQLPVLDTPLYARGLPYDFR